MKRVSRREFQQYTSKYLKELPIVITMRGVDDLILKEVTEQDLRWASLKPKGQSLT